MARKKKETPEWGGMEPFTKDEIDFFKAILYAVSIESMSGPMYNRADYMRAYLCNERDIHNAIDEEYFREADIAEAKRLLAKHGIKLEGQDGIQGTDNGAALPI